TQVVKGELSARFFLIFYVELSIAKHAHGRTAIAHDIDLLSLFLLPQVSEVSVKNRDSSQQFICNCLKEKSEFCSIVTDNYKFLQDVKVKDNVKT
ncbi:hypothetical protein, partial [Vibrio fujianensis]|uniref:hypothetical protein n=1 Tax=Vibrio fujianensis TaxID=1974215 RepID=UPI001C12B99D